MEDMLTNLETYGYVVLFLYSFDDGNITKEKKDPYGITVTEVYHINKMMDDSYKLNNANIKTIKKLLKERFERDS